jgi:hypothetical protein
VRLLIDALLFLAALVAIAFLVAALAAAGGLL